MLTFSDRQDIAQLYVTLQEFVDYLSEKDRLIFISRVLPSRDQLTLQAIAEKFNITRESVRQRQATLILRIQDQLRLDEFDLSQRLPEVLDDICYLAGFISLIENLLSDKSVEPRLLRFLAHTLLTNAGYHQIDNEYVSNQTLEVLETLRTKVYEIADEYGHVDHWQLLAAFPTEAFQAHLPWFVGKLELKRELSSYAIRSNRSVKLNAAHTIANRPLSRFEVCDMCEITNKIASSVLSNTKNLNQVSRLHWVPSDWRLHQYQGIVNEMIAYINSAGGKVPHENLVQMIVSKFDVKPESLQTYLQTSKFVFFDDDVAIVESPFDSMQWMHFSKNLQQTQEGNLTFSFRVSERHFRGFSVVCVPYIFTKLAGCPFDDNSKLKVINLTNCEVTVQSHLASTTQGTIGYVTDAFEKAKLRVGDYAYFECKKEGVVELHRHGSQDRLENYDPSLHFDRVRFIRGA